MTTPPAAVKQTIIPLNQTFAGFLSALVASEDKYGDLARSIARDPCFPESPTYVQCVDHLAKAHASAGLDVLQNIWWMWVGTWNRHNPFAKEIAEAAATRNDGFAPREDICAVAEELGIHTKHRNDFCKAWCPYHSPGEGSGEPSLVLWRDINVFRCESPRCFVWGFPDQLRAGKYQGIHN